MAGVGAMSSSMLRVMRGRRRTRPARSRARIIWWTEGVTWKWRRDVWCISQIDGTYVARRKRPVVCFDESPTWPIAAAPGQLERYDGEYRRNGTANLFIFLDAHLSLRTVESPTVAPPATAPNACATSSTPRPS